MQQPDAIALGSPAIALTSVTRPGGWTVRPAATGDAPAIHALIRSHRAEGHLLPRDLADIERHVSRFVVVEQAGTIEACAELAPLSARVAEVRSLVVSPESRRHGVGGRLVAELRRRARQARFEWLCALAHDPRFFLHLNFSIVPHAWLPEKIVKDCLACPIFRSCGQYAMVLSLREGERPETAPSVFTHRHAAVA